jgi:hypothetical protein
MAQGNRYRPLIRPSISVFRDQLRVSPKECTPCTMKRAPMIACLVHGVRHDNGRSAFRGLQIAMRLPIRSILTKQKLTRDSVMLLRALSATARADCAEVESRGPAFGRVKQVEIRRLRAEDVSWVPRIPRTAAHAASSTGTSSVLPSVWSHVRQIRGRSPISPR